MGQNKFQFDTDFQQEILQFTVTDIQAGSKAISLFESEYFTLIEHCIIAEGIKRYFERKFVVPSKAVLKEELRTMFKTKKWSSLVTPADREKTLKVINKIYNRPVRNAESVYEKCLQFAQYCALKDQLENVDLEDFNSWERLGPNIIAAVSKGSAIEEDEGIFIIADAKSRVTKRQDATPGEPTPFRQLNETLNNGGTVDGNIITVMGEEKKFKTGVMINTTIGYLKRGKVILIADFENGQDSLATRFDQSILGTDRKTLVSGKVDNKLLKMLRKYGRYGGEVIVKRFNAGETAVNIGNYIDKVKERRGKTVEILICDYPDIMGDTKGSKAEHERIGQVYLDLKNLAEKKKLKATYCPSHITREASKNSNKKRKSSDASKAQDKSRHADINLSLEQTPEEAEAGVMRLEIVNQRDGISDGRVYFWADIEKQRLKELTREEVKEMEALRKEQLADERSEQEKIEIRNTNKKKVRDV